MSLITASSARVVNFRTVLVRGLLSGLLAGIIAGCVGFVAGEALIDQAIAIESSETVAHSHEGPKTDEAAAEAGHSHDDGDAALVSRDGQRVGLILATTLTGGALGVVLAVVWFVASRRFNAGASAIMRFALAGWVAVGAVPFVIIPPNPPAVGSAETIDHRTSIWLMAVLLGLGAMAIWYLIRRWMQEKQHSSELVDIVPALSALIIVLAGWMMMPDTGTDYTGFPADLLWNFRISSVATQLALWICLGLGFQYLLERHIRSEIPR